MRSQEGKPLGNATVACLKSASDSTVIAQVATGDNGQFTLQKPAGMLPIRISLLGYKTRILMADEGNLDTITLIAHDLAIDEVRVGQSNQVLSASGATYYPSHAAKRRSFSGFDVLSKLGMEQLVFNRQNESISTLTGGTVQVLLNGEPVSTKELSKLPPKQIQRVEYSDAPSALYPDAAGVLNVVVKRPETGGDFHGETTQPLMVKRNWIRSGVTLYFPHQMLQIGGFSQYSNYPGQIEFGEAEYRFPTGTVTRKVEPIPARYQAWDRHAELWYRWYNERRLSSLYQRYLMVAVGLHW